MALVFVDADVLAQATPRTLLYLASAYEECDYSLIYSAHVEREAERAQRPGARPVSELRKRWLWGVVPDVGDVDSFGLTDTHWKDKPVLAAAIAAGAEFIVSGNIKDFGVEDLIKRQITVVHPGHFLAHRLTEEIYTEIIDLLAAGRRLPPNTALDIHIQEVSDELPDLFQRFQHTFGPAESARTKGPLHDVIRGPRPV